MYDLIIVGGGPAGLTAAVYAVRKHLEVQLISKDIGGKANYSLQVPGITRHLVINGEEVISRFASEIEYLDFARVMDGVESIEKTAEGFKVKTEDSGTFDSKALIYATGAMPRMLEIPGEREFIGRGLSYSAVSYAPLFVDRNTVVVGNTPLAFRAAAELSHIAKTVTLVAPEHGELDTPLAKRVEAALNVTFIDGCELVELKGDEFARQLVVKHKGETRTLEAGGFFVELGLVPNVGLVEDLVDLDDEGFIKVDQRTCTRTPGLFAAGDVTNALAEQVLIAVGEGAKAALSAHEYLLSLPATGKEAAA